MPKSNSRKDRVASEVTTSAGRHHVEASTVAELRKVLAPLLPDLTAARLKDVAFLAFKIPVTITTPGWSVSSVEG
ncbi:hypothetical protein [Deinococcus aluminii]|uniref:Uncharacterized protein n=1 Tax=Deinococcus aluminii TaxID=1656885 RepID=A0ABP9XF28_9DEIO